MYCKGEVDKVKDHNSMLDEDNTGVYLPSGVSTYNGSCCANEKGGTGGDLLPWRDAGAMGMLVQGGLGVRERIDDCTCTAARFGPFEHIQASKSANP